MRRTYTIKKIIPLICIFISMTICGCSSAGMANKDNSVHTTDLFAMDTYMNLKAYGDKAECALVSAKDRIMLLEGMLDVTSASSDIWQLDNANGNEIALNKETAEIIKAGIMYGEQTNGALDITIYPVLREWGFTTGEYKVPPPETIDSLLKNVDYSKIEINNNNARLPQEMQVDLGSLAKGYTSDAVIEIFRSEGVKSAIVSLGGNVQALGRKPDGSKWTVAVVDPFSTDSDMCIVEIDGKAVITSGNYERYFTDENGKRYWHIIDPDNGYPADNGLVSVTIIGDSGLMCDALSTALFVSGKDRAVDYWRNDQSFDMILVTDDGKILYTPQLKDSFHNLSKMSAEVISLA